jgi:hypothetical protein
MFFSGEAAHAADVVDMARMIVTAVASSAAVVVEFLIIHLH